MARQPILGIDLGGALMHTTGYAVLSGSRRPRLEEAGLLPRSKKAAEAELTLRNLIERLRPALVAVDAPLTLPPCLVCPSFCRGPDPEFCELEAARAIWAAGGNPATERLCELRLREEIGGGKPLPTMRIGQIAGRGVALARRVAAPAGRSAPVGGPEVIEVYPTATLKRLFPRTSKRSGRAFRQRALRKLGLAGSDPHGDFLNPHIFDATVAAYTGWLPAEALEQPPTAFNVAAGWIWLPKRG